MGKLWFASLVYAVVGNLALASPTPESLRTFSVAPAQAQSVTSLLPGDVLRLEVQGLSVSEDSGKVPTDFEVQSVDSSTSLIQSGWSVRAKQEDGRLILSAIPLKSGPVTLPPLVIFKKTGDESVPLGRTEAFTLEVQKLESKEPPPDLLPPVEMPFPLWTAISIVLVILVSIALGIAYLIRWSRKKRTLPALPPKPAPILPEDLVALRALDELKALELWKKGLHKRHYFTLSEILKAYLSGRYEIDAIEATSTEILGFLKGAAMSGSDIPELKKLFDELDRVKFTDFIPHATEGEAILQSVYRFVENTKKTRTVSNAV